MCDYQLKDDVTKAADDSPNKRERHVVPGESLNRLIRVRVDDARGSIPRRRHKLIASGHPITTDHRCIVGGVTRERVTRQRLAAGHVVAEAGVARRRRRRRRSGSARRRRVFRGIP